MSEQPSRPRLFSRAPAKVDVQGFLNGLVDSAPEVQQMREDLAEADRNIAALRQQVEVLKSEVNRVELMRRQWSECACEMQIQLEVMATISAQAAEQTASVAVGIAQQARKSLDAAKEKLARSGMAMPAPSIHSVVSDEDTARIAQMLAPRPQEDVS